MGILRRALLISALLLSLTGCGPGGMLAIGIISAAANGAYLLCDKPGLANCDGLFGSSDGIPKCSAPRCVAGPERR